MPLLEARIAALARQRATAVSLRDLYQYGHRPSPRVRLQSAIFLQRELPIRMAQRIEELRTLPFGLKHSKPICDVTAWYSSFIESLIEMPPLASGADEERFTAAVETMLQTPSLVEVMLSSAVLQSKGSGGGAGAESGAEGRRRREQRAFMQSILNRFFTARIGLRFLMEHHIASGVDQAEGWSGIIQANFCPTKVIRAAAEDATFLCDEEFGESPEVVVRMEEEEDAPSSTRNSRLTGVPSHMHYILLELLKNAMRATATRHEERGEDGGDGEDMPPITVTASFGKDSLGVRISDEGGGLSLTDSSRCWRWAHTTAPVPLIEIEGAASSGTGSQPPQQLRRSALAGYGMGLPLSRLHAQYLGGRLDLRSLEGHGTDCFLHLPRLGAACETLPAMVRLSPSASASTLEEGEEGAGAGAGAGGGGGGGEGGVVKGEGGMGGSQEPAAEHAQYSQYSLGEKLSEYEHAVLSEKLAEIRQGAEP